MKKIWVDDVRTPPDDSYWWAKTVHDAVRMIRIADAHWGGVELLDMDHDAGEFAKHGGDYIRILDWIESSGRSCPIRIHSKNPVGVQNMRAIIRKNGWTEIYA